MRFRRTRSWYHQNCCRQFSADRDCYFFFVCRNSGDSATLNKGHVSGPSDTRPFILEVSTGSPRIEPTLTTGRRASPIGGLGAKPTPKPIEYGELEEEEIEGIGFRLEFSLSVIMRPETVRRLFDAMEITDDPPPDPPTAAVIDNVVFRQTLVGPERRASLPDVPGLDQDLTDDQLRRITDMVKSVITTRCYFRVFPPREVVEEPAVLRADDVVERLLHTKWWLAFNDGREELVSFPELIAMTYQLVMVNATIEEVQRDMQSKGETDGTVDIDASFNLWELLQPDMARSLLRRLSIEGSV